ncbi:hypothetical protein EI94DRAFT_606960 [Lactarius quietus]|nr:hypothetical protein EI94DRAFT_606960 [Lactarius quietus]
MHSTTMLLTSQEESWSQETMFPFVVTTPATPAKPAKIWCFTFWMIVSSAIHGEEATWKPLEHFFGNYRLSRKPPSFPPQLHSQSRFHAREPPKPLIEAIDRKYATVIHAGNATSPFGTDVANSISCHVARVDRIAEDLVSCHETRGFGVFS